MTFTFVPIKDLTLESSRAGGITDLAAYIAANGVAAAATTYWVAPHGTYNSSGGTGTSNYSPTGTTPNSDKLPAQPSGFSGQFGNGPEHTALSATITSMVKAGYDGVLLLVSNTSGANALTVKPVAGANPPAGQASKASADTATVVPLGKVGVLGPFTSAELAQADGTFQFTCTGTTPTGFVLAVRVDKRSS